MKPPLSKFRGLHSKSLIRPAAKKNSPGPLDKRLVWMRKKLVSWQKTFVGRSSFKSRMLVRMNVINWYTYVDIYTYTCKLTIWVCSGTTTILANHDFVWNFSNNMSSHVDGSQWTTVIHHCFFKKSCASLLKSHETSFNRPTPPGKLTNVPWKSMVAGWTIPFELVAFFWEMLVFREGTYFSKPVVVKLSLRAFGIDCCCTKERRTCGNLEEMLELQWCIPFAVVRRDENYEIHLPDIEWRNCNVRFVKILGLSEVCWEWDVFRQEKHLVT